jgi:hypothetical protein
MYPNLDFTPTQAKQHLKHLEIKQNKVDKKIMLINDINNYFKEIIYSRKKNKIKVYLRRL